MLFVCDNGLEFHGGLLLGEEVSSLVEGAVFDAPISTEVQVFVTPSWCGCAVKTVLQAADATPAHRLPSSFAGSDDLRRLRYRLPPMIPAEAGRFSDPAMQFRSQM